MILAGMSLLFSCRCIPRESGDDPYWDRHPYGCGSYSPRERG